MMLLRGFNFEMHNGLNSLGCQVIRKTVEPSAENRKPPWTQSLAVGHRDYVDIWSG
jgi:hypothetical protein